jgi:hypothetical protein
MMTDREFSPWGHMMNGVASRKCPHVRDSRTGRHVTMERAEIPSLLRVIKTFWWIKCPNRCFENNMVDDAASRWYRVTKLKAMIEEKTGPILQSMMQSYRSGIIREPIII